MNKEPTEHNKGDLYPGKPEQEPAQHPHVYVASVADFKRGNQHGVWLDAAREPEAMYTDIDAMLATSPIPGSTAFAIHDARGFGVFSIHETDSIELISRVARGITAHGLAFSAWAEVHEGYPELFGHFPRAYIGQFNSLLDYARSEIERKGYAVELDRIVPPEWRPFVRIDPQAFADDLINSGDINVFPAIDGGVWLFDERA